MLPYHLATNACFYILAGRAGVEPANGESNDNPYSSSFSDKLLNKVNSMPYLLATVPCLHSLCNLLQRTGFAPASPALKAITLNSSAPQDKL